MSSQLTFAFSPCPNDTFQFLPWVLKKIDTPFYPSFYLHDIQELNQRALNQEFDIVKVSFGCYRQLKENYTLLPFGGALGFDCGPKLIARDPLTRKNILTSKAKKKIAIPGKNTTAYLLFKRYFPQEFEELFCPYHEIVHLVKEGLVDLGLIIHETRFTFLTAGLHEVCDLGQDWHQETNLPLPLGAIVAKSSLGNERIDTIAQILKSSIQYAYQHPKDLQETILQYAQEKEWSIAKKHIDLYVNQESLGYSENGLRAIELLT